MDLSTFADRDAESRSLRRGKDFGPDFDRPIGPPPDRPRAPFTYPFFDPAAMFRAWADFLTPVRFLSHLIVPLALVALASVLFNWHALTDHVGRVFASLGFWQAVLVGMFTANLVTKLSLGTVMGYYRADSREFGFKLKFGIIPKFYVDRSPIRTLDLHDRRICYATSLLAKLALFAIGIFCWSMLRRTGSGLADVCLAFGLTGLTSFLFVANPLLPMDGCKWLSARLGRPHLREHAFKLTELLITRRPIPAGLGPVEGGLMVLYVVLSVAFIAVLVYSILSGVAFALERQFQGTGVVLFCLVLAMLVYFFLSLRNRRHQVAAKRTKSRPRPMAPKRPPAGPAAPIAPAAGLVAPGWASPGLVAPALTDARTQRTAGEAADDASRGASRGAASGYDREGTGADGHQEVGKEAMTDDRTDTPRTDTPRTDTPRPAPAAASGPISSSVAKTVKTADATLRASADEDATPRASVDADDTATPRAATPDTVITNAGTADTGISGTVTPQTAAMSKADKPGAPAPSDGSADDEDAAALDALLGDDLTEDDIAESTEEDDHESFLKSLLDAPVEPPVLRLDPTQTVESSGEGGTPRDPFADELDDLLSDDADPAAEEAEEDADFLDALSGGKARPADPNAPRSPGLDDVLAPLPDTDDPNTARRAGTALYDNHAGTARDGSAALAAPRRGWLAALFGRRKPAAQTAAPLRLDTPARASGETSIMRASGETSAPIPPKPEVTHMAAEPRTPDDIYAPGQPLAPASGNRPARRKKPPREVNPNPGGSDDLDRVLQMGTHRPRRRGRWIRRFVWLLILAGLIWLAFRPWAFEVGGEFVIQPLDRAEVRTRTDGEITELRVAEGDWVETGAVMAVLSNWDEKRDIAVREAEILQLNAELQGLLDGPSAQTIAVAEKKLASAQVRAEIEAADLAQAERLFSAGTTTGTAVEDARADLRLAEAGVNEAIAELDLARAEATPSEIAAARAEIAKHQEDLAFARLKLDQTFVTATSQGQVVRPEDQPLAPIGTYLPEGGLFAELEDNRTVIAEIEVPETSIEEVKLGAEVELRSWADTGFSFYGTVQRLAPKAEEREFGRVIRVLVEVPNEEAKLAANMTGHGKIAVEERPVWQVFTRIIVRFFEVELWSWLP